MAAPTPRLALATTLAMAPTACLAMGTPLAMVASSIWQQDYVWRGSSSSMSTALALVMNLSAHYPTSFCSVSFFSAICIRSTSSTKSRPELTDIDLEIHVEIWVFLGNYPPGFGNGSGFGGTEPALSMAIVAPAGRLDMARALALW